MFQIIENNSKYTNYKVNVAIFHNIVDSHIFIT